MKKKTSEKLLTRLSDVGNFRRFYVSFLVLNKCIHYIHLSPNQITISKLCIKLAPNLP